MAVKFRNNNTQPRRKPMKIKTGDKVIVILGKSRSKEVREVIGVVPATGKVIVENVNVMKDRQRSTQNQNEIETIEKAFPIDRSNVALVDPKTNKATRIKTQVRDGKRVRTAKSGEVID